MTKIRTWTPMVCPSQGLSAALQHHPEFKATMPLDRARTRRVHSLLTPLTRYNSPTSSRMCQPTKLPIAFPPLHHLGLRLNYRGKRAAKVVARTLFLSLAKSASPLPEWTGAYTVRRSTRCRSLWGSCHNGNPPICNASSIGRGRFGSVTRSSRKGGRCRDGRVRW